MRITLVLVAAALLFSLLIAAAPIPESLKFRFKVDDLIDRLAKNGQREHANNLKKLQLNPATHPEKFRKSIWSVTESTWSNRNKHGPKPEFAGREGLYKLSRSTSATERVHSKWKGAFMINDAPKDPRDVIAKEVGKQKYPDTRSSKEEKAAKLADREKGAEAEKAYLSDKEKAKKKPLPDPKLRATEVKAHVNALSEEPLPTTRTFTGKLMDTINPSRTYGTERYIPAKERYKGPPLTLRLRIKAMNGMDAWRKPKANPVVGRTGNPRLTNPRVQPSGGFTSGLRSGFKSIGSILGKIRL